jgi:hypothetical protein
VEVVTDGRSRHGILTAWEKLGGEWWAYIDHESDDDRIHVYASERIQGAAPPTD